MTFKQLIDKYSFEEIIPELLEIWDKGNIFRFREAHDILRRLTPAGDNLSGVIQVHRVVGIRESYNRVSNLSGYGWDENLGWEIEVSKECGLTEKQLLALCLWERTFYGFSPHQQENTFESWDKELKADEEVVDNPYYRQFTELKRKHYRKRARKHDSRSDKRGLQYLSLEETDHRRENYRDRKSRLRYERRCEYLEGMSEKAEMIKDVCAKYTTLSPDTLKFLFEDGEVRFLPFIGLSNDPEDAIDYIVKSVTDYSDLPLIASPDNILLLIRVPSGYYIDERGKEKLLSALKTKLGFTPRHFHVRTADEVEALHITVVFLERNR